MDKTTCYRSPPFLNMHPQITFTLILLQLTPELCWQIITFLQQNAHPRVAQRVPTVPENVTDQVSFLLYLKKKKKVLSIQICI